MAMTAGLTAVASSSGKLLSPAAAVCRPGCGALAGRVRMGTAGGRPGAQGMRTSSSGMRRVRGVRAAAVSEAPAARIGVVDTEGLPVKALMEALEAAGRRGAEVIMAAVDKPRNIDYKGKADLVTDTDRNTELAILEVVRERFPGHLILGEEGGVSGDPTSEYLWCIDPLDGTTNFAHGYPCFAVSIAVLYRGRPLAATVVEFAGGPFAWVTRTFLASAGGGAFCNGQRIHVSSTDMIERSLLVTGFGYDHDKAWETNLDLFKYYTDVSRGVRRLGSAATDCCHVALGITESYWEFRLKPWDMAAGVLIVEEAGGKVTRMDGGPFTVFDRSVIVSNGVIHDKLLEKIQPATEKLIADGLDFTQWMKPTGYMTDV
ncbi:hypothetical protein M758_8G009700 [Ceratodon purpureus]|uniref:Inositol-1-monophosphatase n=1 Tax=Ceratodon purpureus TaxID=3225 RepID=A0A8T0GTZ4_CERPU|nr:hypothetical protein KC19_8G010300 [Ceratodon purpureus]KAG0607214.1 hypothetical protein M758_8G009700 [Ceratodon purpureus]